MARKKKNNSKPKNIVEKLNDDDFKVEEEDNHVVSREVEKNDKKETFYDDIEYIKDYSKKKKNNSNDKNNLKDYKHPFINIFLIVTMIASAVNFIINIMDNEASISILVNSAILCLFSIIFLGVCFTIRKKNKNMILFSSVILLVYFLLNINSSLNIISSPISEVINLSGKNITDAIKWANKNNIKVTQEYEFSDSVPEYKIISQSVLSGTNIDSVDEIVLTISEGPNPYKEVVVPSMITWDAERVINFVINNYLTNVVVEFIESDQVKNTVIEQSKSGNLLRNDELKLTFSYGEGNEESVSMIDFSNKSLFEIEFFMKQHHLKYKFDYKFSNKIKKGYGISQSLKHGETTTVDGEEIIVTISKGPKIEIPKLTNMSITEITDWAVKNKLKLEFNDRYDDSVKKGKVISIDREVGDIIEQGTTIKVTLSLGKLKMPEFSDANKFYEWADKYGIKYEVAHEFNDSVEAGKIVSISSKKGQTLKNDEVIKVTVSDGKKRSVPNVVGLTKNQASSKLESAGLKYNFVYKNSSTTKNKVLSQSISSGSEVPDGTTITITLSNGKSTSGGNSGGGSNSGGNNSGGGNTPTPAPKPTCDTSKGNNFWFMAGSTGADTYSMTKNQNPGFTINVNYVDSCPNGNTSSGTLCSKSISDGQWVSYCTTISMTVVK